MSDRRRPGWRRLIDDLRQPDQRGDAIRRVRRRAAQLLPVDRGDGVGRQRSDRPEAWYVRQWSRLATAVAGTGAATASGPDPGRPADIIGQAKRQRAEATLAAAIARGEPLERALLDTIAALADLVEWPTAWSIAEGVGRLPGGSRASALGHALILHRRHQADRIWRVLGGLDDRSLAAFLPVEAVEGALAAGTAEARARALAIAAQAESMEAAVLVELAGRLLVFGERATAAQLVDALRRRPGIDLDGRRLAALASIEAWLEPEASEVPAGAVALAILDDRSPDVGSNDDGEDEAVQALSLLANLARLDHVTFSGDGGLGDLATELQARVRPELRTSNVAGSVHLIPLARDFSSADAVPEGTWLFAFGPHLHPLFGLRSDFPYRPGLRPIFLSFRVNEHEALTDEAQAYLRQYGPVGCRDWSTVFLLLSAGIDAFFSGCLTTTIDAIFPSRAMVHGGDGPIGIIGLPREAAGAGRKKVRVEREPSAAEGDRPWADRLRAADESLAAWQRDLDGVVTDRLHVYLPLTALGLPVDFRTPRPGDVRLAGLTGLQPGSSPLAQMQGGIRGLIGVTLDRIVSGADEVEVYETWREMTRERVAEARARFEAPVVDPPTTIDIAAAVATSLGDRRSFGPHANVDPSSVADVVLSFDQNVTLPAAVLVESVVANASGPIRLWVLSRGLSDAYQHWLAAAFPALPMTFLPCDQVTYGPAGRPRRVPARITISTMDRLLLPLMLDDVDRVVYLDVDTLMLDDVCRLAKTDLGGRPIGARVTNVSEASEWLRAGRRLEEPLALELRRAMGQRHGYGHAALNAGVLVLDLERMRRDDFTRTYLGWVERYGLHDQDTMLAYAGPDRCVLDPRWNALPVLEDVHDPGLIHWASFGRPWDPVLAFEQERWRRYAAQLQDRAGAPPTV